MTTTHLIHTLHAAYAWGAPVGDEEHAARCRAMTAWLSEHEGNALSIVVRPCRRDEVEGTRLADVGGLGGSMDLLHHPGTIEDATGDAVTTDGLRDLLHRAWEAACRAEITEAAR